MSGLVIIHITPAIPFELSIQVCLHANEGDILFICQEFIHSGPGPFRVSCWGENAFCKEHINNLSQAGSGEVILKYASDGIRLFFMNDNLLVIQNITIWKFRNCLTF